MYKKIISILTILVLFQGIAVADAMQYDTLLEVQLPDGFIPEEHFAKNKNTFEPSGEPPTFNAESTVDYLIITDTSHWNIINSDFKQWKIIHDMKIDTIAILNISNILSDPDCWVNGTYGDATNKSNGNPWIEDNEEITTSFELFNDTQCKIRNCIRKYVNEYHTNYVLLVGNKNILPVRMASTYAHSGPSGSWYNDLSHACDMYYACLNNSMNNNTNDRWMENRFGDGVYWASVPQWDKIDWEYDVLLGRALVSNSVELFNWINKTKKYRTNISSYLDNSIVASKDSSNNIDDYVWTQIRDEFPDKINFLNNQNISQTQWNILDDYCNGLVDGWNGFNLIYHSGHGGTLYSPYQPSNLNNNKWANFLYTEGCNSADFGTDTSSRMENWMKDDGGVYGGISNSAYGWFIASTWYGEEMFKIMFNESYGVFEKNFCKAHFDARENIGWELHSVAPMIFKETNFFGDPSIEYHLSSEEFEIQPLTINNQSTNVSCTTNYWNVSIINASGNVFDWVIETSPDIGNASGNNEPSGTKSCSLTSLDANTNYTVYVNVSNNYNYVFWFETPELYQPTDESPFNNSYIDIYDISLSCNINNYEHDIINVSFYWGNGTKICDINNTTSSYFLCNLLENISLNWLEHDTIYNWYVNISDGINYTGPVWSFKTCKSWDIVPDGNVNYLDASLFVSNYLQTVEPAGSESWDINNDGNTNYLDASTLVSHYGWET